MEDNENLDSPDISDNHTKKEIENNNPKFKIKSIISIFIIVAIFLLATIIIFNFLVSKENLDVKKKVFSLSDNSTLLFLDDKQYILNYQIMDKEIIMKGKYKITYGEHINENLLYQYSYYIEQFNDKNYTLGFLELQNDELYINNNKMNNDEGYINTYYILMAYYEDDTLIFYGYNVDTGIKIKFTQQVGEYANYYDKFVN